MSEQNFDNKTEVIYFGRQGYSLIGGGYQEEVEKVLDIWKETMSEKFINKRGTPIGNYDTLKDDIKQWFEFHGTEIAKTDLAQLLINALKKDLESTRKTGFWPGFSNQTRGTSQPNYRIRLSKGVPKSIFTLEIRDDPQPIENRTITNTKYRIMYNPEDKYLFILTDFPKFYRHTDINEVNWGKLVDNIRNEFGTRGKFIVPFNSMLYNDDGKIIVLDQNNELDLTKPIVNEFKLFLSQNRNHGQFINKQNFIRQKLTQCEQSYDPDYFSGLFTWLGIDFNKNLKQREVCSILKGEINRIENRDLICDNQVDPVTGKDIKTYSNIVKIWFPNKDKPICYSRSNIIKFMNDSSNWIQNRNVSILEDVKNITDASQKYRQMPSSLFKLYIPDNNFQFFEKNKAETDFQLVKYYDIRVVGGLSQDKYPVCLLFSKDSRKIIGNRYLEGEILHNNNNIRMVYDQQYKKIMVVKVFSKSDTNEYKLALNEINILKKFKRYHDIIENDYNLYLIIDQADIPQYISTSNAVSQPTSIPPGRESVIPLEKRQTISAGDFHTLGLLKDGTVVGWGNNDDGQITIPELENGRKFVAISAGGNHSVGLLDNGEIRCWGNNDYEQLDIPVLEEGRKFIAISAGHDHSIAILDNGKVVSWGNNEIFYMSGGKGRYFTAISAGNNDSLGILDNGQLLSWEDEDPDNDDVPVMEDGKKFISISKNESHSLGLLNNGEVVGWDTSGERMIIPFPGEGRKFIAISAGNDHSLGLLDNGQVIGWGNNSNGEIIVPEIESGRRFINITAGFNFSTGLLDNGEVISWGDNEYNQTDIPDGLLLQIP